jgi:hypothetical protein
MVIRVTGQNLGQRTFSRAIWTHERMHFAPWDAKSQAPDDLLIANSNV